MIVSFSMGAEVDVDGVVAAKTTGIVEVEVDRETAGWWRWRSRCGPGANCDF